MNEFAMQYLNAKEDFECMLEDYQADCSEDQSGVVLNALFFDTTQD